MRTARAAYVPYLPWTGAAHLALALLLLLGTYLPGCRQPRPANIPVELIIEVPLTLPAATPAALPEPVAPPAEERDIPEPEPPKPKPPPPKPQPRQEKPIQVSRTLVRRPVNAKPTTTRPTRLTPEEIRRLLERGAKPGPRSTLSDSELRKLLDTDLRFGNGRAITTEQLYLELIRQTMYKAWVQPSALGVAGLVTRVEFTFEPSGNIVNRRLLSGSGNAVMDASVMKAANAVTRVTGIPATFLEAHPRIVVSFELTGE